MGAMTRSTLLAVTSPGLSPDLMWKRMATVLRAPEQYRFTVSDTAIRADLFQGLDALMDLTFAPEGAQIPESGCDDYCLPGCSQDWCWTPAHYLLADFDTAYGATDTCGCHSGGIHIRLLSQLGAWLDDHGHTWCWYDESGDGWRHDSTWGTLARHNEACAAHAATPAPPALAGVR